MHLSKNSAAKRIQRAWRTKKHKRTPTLYNLPSNMFRTYLGRKGVATLRQVSKNFSTSYKPVRPKIRHANTVAPYNNKFTRVKEVVRRGPRTRLRRAVNMRTMLADPAVRMHLGLP